MTSQIIARCLAAISIVLSTVAFAAVYGAGPDDPLPSWNDGPSKKAIIDFVDRVTREGGPDFVPPAERIATFDNDGTLWSEQPNYVQAFFIVDRVKALASQHPEWQKQEPFASVLKGDLKKALSGGMKGLDELVMATHAGMTTNEFDETVKDWLKTAKHPRFDRPFTECVYQPMLELLAYLRGAGFKTYIVSGGGVEFLRTWADAVYGVPPEQVVGSSIQLEYQERDGQPALVRLPKLDFLDDKAGKPVAIQTHIGRRPIAAFGNSDGDFEMLEWTTSGPGPRLGVLVHHTDADREWAYDRQSHVGRLDKALDAAPERGWVVVDMQREWKTIYSDAK